MWKFREMGACMCIIVVNLSWERKETPQVFWWSSSLRAGQLANLETKVVYPSHGLSIPPGSTTGLRTCALLPVLIVLTRIFWKLWMGVSGRGSLFSCHWSMKRGVWSQFDPIIHTDDSCRTASWRLSCDAGWC